MKSYKILGKNFQDWKKCFAWKAANRKRKVSYLIFLCCVSCVWVQGVVCFDYRARKRLLALKYL